MHGVVNPITGARIPENPAHVGQQERLPGTRRSKSHRVVDLEHQRMCQASKVVEALFRAGALQLGALRFKHGCEDSADETENDKACGYHSDFVSLNEFNGAIIERVFLRSDWTTFQIAANVI